MLKKAGLVVGALVLLLVSGCGSDELPAVQRQLVPPNPDRDLAKVLAGINRIDPCVLVDPARVRLPGFAVGDPVRLKTPYSCEVRGESASVTVSLFKPFRSDLRREPRRLRLGAAVAYGVERGCDVAIPVTFDHAIVFSQEPGSRTTADRCSYARNFAAEAVPLLAKPSGSAPARWDACSLLVRALGSKDNRPDSDLDRCTIGTARIELHSVSPQADPWRFERTKVVAGRQVGFVTSKSFGTTDERCVLVWEQGATGVKAGPHPQQQRLGAPTCEEAENLAEVVIGLLGSRRSPDEVQSPLYFRSGEPVQAAPGACAFVTESEAAKDCQPYSQAAVPKAADLHKQAKADPHVLCAIADESVREQFGTELRAVVARRTCQFVQPSGELRIEIDSSPHPLRPAPARETTMGGRSVDLERVRLKPDMHLDRYGISLSPSSHLTIAVTLRPDSGAGVTPAPKPAIQAKIERVVGLIVQRLK